MQVVEVSITAADHSVPIDPVRQATAIRELAWVASLGFVVMNAGYRPSVNTGGASYPPTWVNAQALTDAGALKAFMFDGWIITNVWLTRAVG